MYQIEITGATGTGPYDIYVCDYTLTYCVLAGSGISFPPNFLYTLVYPLDIVSSVMVKMIDSNGCEFLHLYNCPTATPTPTPTLTPTTTPSECRCIQFENISPSSVNIEYIQCDGNYFYGSVPALTTIYVCGNSPFAEDGVVFDISLPCTEGACNPIPPPPSATPTQTPTLTPTITPTQTITPTITPTPTQTPPNLAFISTWNTTNTSPGSTLSNQVKLPLVSLGTYNFIVDWGDGGPTDTITLWNQPETTHTYSSSGDYTITITGLLEGWSFQQTGDLEKITGILQWGCFSLGPSTISNSAFAQCINLTLNSVSDVLNLSGVTHLARFLGGCTSITTISNVSSWDVSNITSMFSTFGGCSSFDQDLSSWVVSNVTTMFGMFASCTIFNNGGSLGIDSWDVSSVTSMSSMFSQCTMFNQSISSWDVSSVTSMSGMFQITSSFNQDLNTWNVSGVTNMASMFNSALNFNQPLDNWDVSDVTNMSSMFNNTANFNKPIDVWNVSGVTDMSNMFNTATSFNQPLGNWDVSNVTNMNNMFNNAPLFDQDLGSWNVSSVVLMFNMFNGVTLSTPNYNSLLNGWASLGGSLQSSVTFNGGNSVYTIATAGASRTYLTGTKLWSISDGGGI
jgi:surface protein